MRRIAQILEVRQLLRGRVHVFVLPLWIRKTIGYCLPPYFSRARFRSVYVVTYGRSGSTLLTRWLSTLPGFNIKGENCLFMIPAFECEARLSSAMHYKSPGGFRWIGDGPKNPWNGAGGLSLERWRRDISNAILEQLYPRDLIPHTIGFKEIRWHSIAEDDRERQLDWLCSLRSPGAVIFLFRDLDEVMNSGWWRSLPADKARDARQSLQEFEAWAIRYSDANAGVAQVLDYRDFVSGPAAASRICQFLGVPFSRSKWRRIVAEPLLHLK